MYTYTNLLDLLELLLSAIYTDDDEDDMMRRMMKIWRPGLLINKIMVQEEVIINFLRVIKKFRLIDNEMQHTCICHKGTENLYGR